MTHQPSRHGPWKAAIPLGMILFMLCVVPWPVCAGEIENDVCAACHEDYADGFAHTAHGVYFNSRPALAEFGCESCHGSGIEHVEDPQPGNILNPANADQFGSSLLCLTCHKNDQFDDWQFSSHNGAGINCASCHESHQPLTEHPAKASSERCYTCHQDVRSATMMPSRHPIGEGKLDCTDCHNPHGSQAMFVQDFTRRELCFSCHANVEGPWIYEHPPVNEDCMYCHVPHGSVANSLLKQNEPTLCLNCHSMHFHATVEGYDTTTVSPQAPERSITMHEDSWKSGMLTKCTQCHDAIHGSDHPSQSTSTGGNALTR